MAHAVNCYYPKEYVQPSTREGEVFLRTQKSARQLLDKLDINTTKEWDLLRSARLKLQVSRHSYSACRMRARPATEEATKASTGNLPDLKCCLRLLGGNCSPGTRRSPCQEGRWRSVSMVTTWKAYAHVRAMAVIALPPTAASLQELSCVDLSLDVTDRALEIVRNQIEEATTQAKVEASNLLLRELEEEKAAKKVRCVARCVRRCL